MDFPVTILRPNCPAIFAGGGGGGGFAPSDLAALLFWYKKATGITGNPVSQWSDQTANAFHGLQATGTQQPADSGGGIITFDGVGGTGDYLAAAFGATKAQPLTVYLRGRQITWTLNDNIFDSTTGAADSTTLGQTGVSPQVGIYASGGGFVALNGDWPVDANFYSVCVVFNGASSSIRVGANAKTTGNPGASGLNGISIASIFNHSVFSNIAVKEMFCYEAAHSDATQDTVIAYLDTL